MPTLQELTLAHSQRLSAIYRTRDEKLADAYAERDAQLQQLPGAVKYLQKFREELADARGKQLTNDARAGAMRSSALDEASEHRSDLLDDAQRARHKSDLSALESRQRGEQAAETRYSESMEKARGLADKERPRAMQDAERERRLEREGARRDHEQALSTAQQHYRGSIDDAILQERRSGRDTDRAYYDALRLADAAVRAALANAEQNLVASLIVLEGAPEILRAYRMKAAAINIEASRAEQEEFSRFRRELADTTVR